MKSSFLVLCLVAKAAGEDGEGELGFLEVGDGVEVVLAALSLVFHTDQRFIDQSLCNAFV